ncbi:MAG: hypothetical protein MH204_02690 [Fimbriimonadaceae bacterium]|nr:hypothetical protein [Fimbriimonadaceae bacterium]
MESARYLALLAAGGIVAVPAAQAEQEVGERYRQEILLNLREAAEPLMGDGLVSWTDSAICGLGVEVTLLEPDALTALFPLRPGAVQGSIGTSEVTIWDASTQDDGRVRSAVILSGRRIRPGFGVRKGRMVAGPDGEAMWRTASMGSQSEPILFRQVRMLPAASNQIPIGSPFSGSAADSERGWRFLGSKPTGAWEGTVVLQAIGEWCHASANSMQCRVTLPAKPWPPPRLRDVRLPASRIMFKSSTRTRTIIAPSLYRTLFPPQAGGTFQQSISGPVEPGIPRRVVRRAHLRVQTGTIQAIDPSGRPQSLRYRVFFPGSCGYPILASAIFVTRHPENTIWLRGPSQRDEVGLPGVRTEILHPDGRLEKVPASQTPGIQARL